MFSLPRWHRHGTQPDYWSETWRRKELLADLDILFGNVFETDDMDDLISRLEAAAATADAAKTH